VNDVRIGKLIHLEVETVEESRIKEMCQKLLANPVIEDFSYEVIG
jgi:phosphoribosylformylglycinamidine synthase